MKKKIAAAVAMTALLVLVLAGCGQGAAEEKASEGEGAAGTEAVEPAEGDASEPADEQQADEAADKPASNATSKPAASNSSGSSASKPSSNGGSSGSKPAESKPQAPAHEHSWTHHPAVYVENPIKVEKVVCSCGAQFDNTSEWSSHNQSLGFGNSHSYSVKKVQVGTEKVLAEAEYWSCSCGATK